MVEISFVKRFLYCLDNYYIWPLVFYWKVHFIAMFNLSPITTIRMIMAMNDVTMQNMFLLTNNILAHKRCVEAKAWFLIELFFFFPFNTWHINLGKFIYLCWIEQRHYCWMFMWQIQMAVMTCELLLTWYEYICVKVYFDVSSKFIKQYLNWHEWKIIEIYLSAFVHRLMFGFTHSLNNNPYFQI